MKEKFKLEIPDATFSQSNCLILWVFSIICHAMNGEVTRKVNIKNAAIEIVKTS